MFAPASSSSSGRRGMRVGRTVAIAGRCTPLMRPRLRIALVATAPELPAETNASARPSFTRRIATLIEQSFFLRTAVTGLSSISATSGAWMTSSVPFFVAAATSLGYLASSASICSLTPTRKTLTSSRPAAASTPPRTISPGALSPPIASRAMRVITPYLAVTERTLRPLYMPQFGQTRRIAFSSWPTRWRLRIFDFLCLGDAMLHYSLSFFLKFSFPAEARPTRPNVRHAPHARTCRVPH